MSSFATRWLLAAVLLGRVLSHAADPAGLPAGTPHVTGVVAPGVEVGRSPVDSFRELLAMAPAERKAALADRPPEIQRQILAKIREYTALRPNERDLRLEVTELYYYLWPLMKTPATNRATQLASVPERERPKVEARLHEWDKLPASKQQELLTNALAVRYFIELQTQPPLPVLAPARAEKLELGIRQWQTLPPDRRQQITARFNQIFSLTDNEKQRTLNTLSEPERRLIEKTLKKFARLTSAEREDYLVCVDKFARLSPEERQQFMKKAERWNALSSDERQEWREVLENLPHPPPLPPGVFPPRPDEAE